VPLSPGLVRPAAAPLPAGGPDHRRAGGPSDTVTNSHRAQALQLQRLIG